MGNIHRLLDEMDRGLLCYPEPEIMDDLQRLILEWPKITEKKKKVIMAILDLE